MSTTPKFAVITSIDKAMNRLQTVCGNTIFLLLGGLIVLLGANILLRYSFNAPIAWSNTVSRYAYIYIVLIGSAIAYLKDGHARVDFFYDKASPRVKKLFDFIHCLIMMSVCVIFIVMGSQHAISMWAVHAPIIPWLPVGLVYLSIPLFALLVFLYLLKKLISLF
ncbi:TRAP transporter small permease [Vibrio sp. JC009]|uniref:TRAP transporter small permease n=1 Tax=Vibrio sp. JC009 TaxID=2912314 RepID=UPI0023B15F64|nr:TRAP transporter small permease [Vibrio sp. JC009]WED22568.1 TRAP transporter small permease [Vibrio sp. JC009]